MQFLGIAVQFLGQIAKKYGKLGRGGVPNMNEAAKLVLLDWHAGKIPYYSAVPDRPQDHLDAAILTELAPEFSL
jgi:nuclear GTP-binding protein